ncbi:hypothetical protein IVA80_16855 [Bradyrhizobium sp. 139]|uniref:hypothetical protein n=1 Tax=Bradyrhizobium sp. 139 TaxID=2782616 RepID=UPI001FF9DCFA|nr:hypothetical protein [Bradyrhizobium sp. 139]MCK1742488.1 hypothetical protein [Bradyrhizobium sp. 139]
MLAMTGRDFHQPNCYLALVSHLRAHRTCGAVDRQLHAIDLDIVGRNVRLVDLTNADSLEARSLDAGQRGPSRLDIDLLDRESACRQIEPDLAVAGLAATAANLLEGRLDLCSGAMLDAEIEAEPSARGECDHRDRADQDSFHSSAPVAGCTPRNLPYSQSRVRSRKAMVFKCLTARPVDGVAIGCCHRGAGRASSRFHDPEYRDPRQAGRDNVV